MTHRILFQDIQKTIEVSDGVSILDAAEKAGVDIPSGCRKGECGTCRIRKILGDIRIVEATDLPGEGSTKEMILSCMSTPQSDLVCELTSASDDETNARVLDVIQQTPDTKTFRLVLDDASFAEFVPGQFITPSLLFDIFLLFGPGPHRDHHQATGKGIGQQLFQRCG